MVPGEVIGFATAIEQVGTSRLGHVWRFRCACGSEFDRAIAQHRFAVKEGAEHCSSCRPRRSPVGSRFGALVVVALIGDNRSVVCDCGAEKVVRADNLAMGRTASCGCQMYVDRVTHRGSGTDIYSIWRGMRARCSNAEDLNYGGRGIDVCEGWSTSFEAFRADMGERPESTSIDRVDNARGYHCGKCSECVRLGRSFNCRWATQKEQARNTRSNVWLELGGTRKLASDWARENGITRQTMNNRLRKGWAASDAVTAPVSAKAQAAGRIARAHALATK